MRLPRETRPTPSTLQALDAIELLPDNLLYETDFPHPTSISPGVFPFSESARDNLERKFAGSRVSQDSLRKVLHNTPASTTSPDAYRGLELLDGWADVELLDPGVAGLGDRLSHDPGNGARIEQARTHFAFISQGSHPLGFFGPFKLSSANPQSTSPPSQLG